MVRLVRSGKSMHAVAAKLHVDPSSVSFWVARAKGRRLDRVDFSDGKPGRAWNRLAPGVEQHIVELRRSLREESVLGEYGAKAIQRALQAELASGVPAVATINRTLARKGLQDGARRIRRAPPPKGWYLPTLAAGTAELDSFDLIEELKIASGPLVWVLNGTSLHGALVDSWPLRQPKATLVLDRLLERWRRDGLPAYAQFDNGTQFQGAHQFADSVGRVSRLCLQLGITPVFAPPREPGLQNAIEAYNGLWLAKVWRRWQVRDFTHLEALSVAYVDAHRARGRARQDAAPERRTFPKEFTLNLHAKPQGTIIYVRRASEQGRVQLLGRTFDVCLHWPHRLVRCEVNLTEEHIRFHALRKREPADQPLLREIPYHRGHKLFQGDI